MTRPPRYGDARPGVPPGPAPVRSRRSPLRLGAVAAVLAGCVGCDQATKRVAIAFLPEGERLSLLGDCVRLERVHNPGAFLGLGAGLPDGVRIAAFVFGVALLVVVALVAAFRPAASTSASIAAALVAGGGLGNLWDRVTDRGLVTDFMNVGLGGLRTGIFNVADLAIVAGAVLLALAHRQVAPVRPHT